MKLTAYDTTGKKLDNWQVKEDLGKANPTLLAQAIRVYQANSHQGTSKVKTRGEVIGSTRKIYRQKGTGNARHGAKYAPIFVGGGIAHGPTGLRAANLILPKKMRQAALRVALLTKLESEMIAGLTGASKLQNKTSQVLKLFSEIAGHPKRSTLVITKNRLDNFYAASRNLQGVKFKRTSLVNAYDLVASDFVVITKPALADLIARTNTTSVKKITNKK